MVKTKHTAHKNRGGAFARASHRGGSDDSQEHQRPRKHAGKRPVIEESSSSEGSDYEEEMEYEERGVHVVVLSRPRGSRRATYMPAPPPDQPNVDGHHIPLEALNFMGVSSRISPKCPSLHNLSSGATLINSKWFKTLWIIIFAPMFRQTSTPLLSSQRDSLCTTSLT
ncbi:hypothetical protein ACQJBY_065625 [Aegilops geniculata]